ncbi:hypothetical protein PYW07_015266 [Mythimna separata]|uniref:Prothoracicotropic hormone n=1 Tax=Mythimna separata TaxID=271217 RepID=A0AAD7YZQ4_MYTSE|nr:hypothetical protein PYW07_015266 [Mythimna separata]
MITRPFVFVIVCFGFFILLQSLVPKVMAMKNSNVDEYMLEDQRTRKRKNYVVRLARDSEILGNSANIGTSYDTDSIQPDATNPEELSAFIVDYANMIRNDVVLLDKSVETRTRKRGNIKVGKHHNQAIQDPACTCNPNKSVEDLGENTFPQHVDIYTCSKQACPWPYQCTENIYNLTVIKRKEMPHQFSEIELPPELQRKWVGEYHPISVGCVCARDYYGRAN